MVYIQNITHLFIPDNSELMQPIPFDEFMTQCTSVDRFVQVHLLSMHTHTPLKCRYIFLCALEIPLLLQNMR